MSNFSENRCKKVDFARERFHRKVILQKGNLANKQSCKLVVQQKWWFWGRAIIRKSTLSKSRFSREVILRKGGFKKISMFQEGDLKKAFLQKVDCAEWGIRERRVLQESDHTKRRYRNIRLKKANNARGQSCAKAILRKSELTRRWSYRFGDKGILRQSDSVKK